MKINFLKYNNLGRNPWILPLTIILLVVVTFIAAFWFFHSAPPNRLVITAGPVGSSLWNYAVEYQKILKKSGVNLVIMPSEGASQNFYRLAILTNKVDIGFVQAGIQSSNTQNLICLGSIAYEPINLFYRSPAILPLISDFKGKRIAVGERGSGTRRFSHLILSNSDVTPGGATTLIETNSDIATMELINGAVDALFLMGDSVNATNMRLLLMNPDIHQYSFIQAEAWTRKMTYLHKLVLPMGIIDFGKNIPSSDITLIGPDLEIVARKTLHPALSDLILEAAEEVHSKPGLFKSKGEFPAPIENEIKISADAKRYYKSGEGFLYKILPFWIASMVNRLLVLILPLIVIFPTIIRGIPSLLQWRIRRRIFRWYRQLLVIEQKVRKTKPHDLSQLYEELDRIEEQVNTNVPVSFAESFYILREHIDFVRERMRKQVVD